jgi:hypothetical protein
MLEGSGHWWMHDAPTGQAAILESFWASVRPDRLARPTVPPLQPQSYEVLMVKSVR